MRDNPGVRKPRKEIRSDRWKHHQQNTRDRRLSVAEDTIENNSQRKQKKQKAPNSKHPGISETQ